jgi:DNA-binding NarL/FixJ family response regulator
MSVCALFSGDDRPRTVVVAEANWMNCQLLADTIQRHNHFRVVASATTRSEIVSAVNKLQPSVALISSRLQDGAFSGLLALRELCTLQVQPRSIILLDEDNPELVVEAFRHGARGIFCRTGASNDLRKCIQCAYDGQIWVNNSQVEHVVKALMQAPAPRIGNVAAIAALSKREKEIARLVASGLSNRETAQRLSLSEHTVKNCLFRVFEKLGISTRVELVLCMLTEYNGPKSEHKEIREEQLKLGA